MPDRPDGSGPGSRQNSVMVAYGMPRAEDHTPEGDPIERAGRGTAAAREPLTVDALFRAHGKDVYRIVRRLLGPGASPADVDDVTQQAFIAAHRDLSRFRGESTPMTWLYGIASKTVLMHLRSWRRRQRMIAAFAEQWLVEGRQEQSAETALAQRQELERVWRCLEKIKPKKRIVFLLHEIEGLSGKEIALALEIPEATVFTRLFHARKELIAGLKKERGP